MIDEDTTLADEVLEALREDPEPLCTWTKNEDEHRRVWVLVQFMSDDLEKMERICRWLKDGTVPPKLKAVH